MDELDNGLGLEAFVKGAAATEDAPASSQESGKAAGDDTPTDKTATDAKTAATEKTETKEETKKESSPSDTETQVRQTVEEALKADLAMEIEAVAQLKAAIAHCEEVKDFVSRELFANILASEEEHVDTLERHYRVFADAFADVPSLGTITLSLAAVGIFYLPIALVTQHQVPTVQSTVSLVALAVVCTAVAFMVFFALIAHVGPARAPLFTYVNPVVAIVLGVIVLGEQLTVGLLIGLPLVIFGCWLAATGGTLRPRRQQAVHPGDLPPIAPG